MMMGYREDQKFDPIKIVDGFFDNPDWIRNIAMESEYTTCEEHIGGGNWPGLRTDFLNNIMDRNVYDEFVSKMYKVLYPDKIIKKSYIESSFQICGEQHGDSWIHQDAHPWNGVSIIYLSPNPQKNSGTIIYEPIDRCYNAYDHSSYSNYKEVETIDNVYNRLVSYDPFEYHKSDTYFGNTIQDSRLTLISFFDVEFVDAEV